MEISQLTKNQLRELRQLTTRSGREAADVFLLEGEVLILEAKQAGLKVQQVLCTDEYLAEHDKVVNSFTDSVTLLTKEQLNSLSQVVTPQEVLAVVKRKPLLSALPADPLLLCLENIADPGNLGTILRTADWFGIKSVLLSAQSVDPYNDKVIRAAMGSLFHLELFLSQNLITDLQRLKKQGYLLVVTDVHGQPGHLPTDQPRCLVVGNEAHGVSKEVLALADYKYTIPGSGLAESLNVAVSTGIMLFDLTVSR